MGKTAGLPLGNCGEKQFMVVGPTFSSPAGLEREAGSFPFTSLGSFWAAALEDLGEEGMFAAASLGNFRIGMEDPSLRLEWSPEGSRSGREEARKGVNLRLVRFPLWSTCDGVFAMPAWQCPGMSSLLGLAGDGEVARRGSGSPVAMIGSLLSLGGIGRGKDGDGKAIGAKSTLLEDKKWEFPG